MKGKKISFVIPCYNSAETIGCVVDEIEETVALIPNDGYEILLVNDSSPDDVFSVISKLCENNANVRGIDLAKNFGQSSSILAGIRYSSGNMIVILDDDGQTPICEVGNLIQGLEDGYDVVFAKYDNKKHALWRNAVSQINDYMAQALIGKPKNLKITSFFAFKRFIADEITRYDAMQPYLAGLLLRSTCKIINISVTHRERISGRSGYTFRKLFALWLNGFIAFSVKPLRIATIIGFLTALTGFVYGAVIIISRMLNHNIPLGYSSTMAALLFIGGMIMVMLGLIGEYVGRTYLHINNTPQYVIREHVGFEDENDKQ